MDRLEIGELLRTRRVLTGETWSDDTVEAWWMVLSDRTFTECLRAMTAAAHEAKRISPAHLFDHMPRDPNQWQPRAAPVCCRCRQMPAVKGRTRCELCQTAVDRETAAGVHSPAMTEAIAAARRLRSGA